jgi:hypothetical protein
MNDYDGGCDVRMCVLLTPNPQQYHTSECPLSPLWVISWTISSIFPQLPCIFIIHNVGYAIIRKCTTGYITFLSPSI